MRIVFMGTPAFAAASLDALLESGHELCGVFCQPDRAVGRGHKTKPGDVKQAVLRAGLPVFQPDKMRDGTALKQLESCRPDIVVVVAYGRLLPDELLDVPPLGCINVHASLLPQLRGAAPIQWAVARGLRQTGVTTMYMAPELDAGDIILSRATDIGPRETAGELHDRLRLIGAELLLETLDRIADGTAPCIPQAHEQASFAPMLQKCDGLLDWTRSAEELDCHIRGMSPWPGAFYKGLRIHSAEPTERHATDAPGTPVDGPYVACGDGRLLRLCEVQSAGGRRMSAEDYLRGHDRLW